MIKGEYGNVLRISAKEDISDNINTVKLRSSSPYVLTRIIDTSDGLTVGISDKTVDGIEFKAGEYIEYEFKEGDIDIAGTWKVCLISLTPDNKNKILNDLSFIVENC